MEKIESLTIPMGQARRKILKNNFKKYRVFAVVGSISIVLLVTYLSLMLQFIQLIKTLN